MFFVFRIAFGQKNQLGFMVGIGCGMVFLVSMLFYIAEMMQILPLTSCSLFFFSYGGSQVIIGDLLIGIVLSIYRYKNLLPTNSKAAEQFPYKVNIVKANTEEAI